MKKPIHGFAYLTALTVATAGFMFGSCTLFAVILWILSWVPVAFWVLIPLLTFMIFLEGVIFVMTMGMFVRSSIVNNWSVRTAWQILHSTTRMGFTIWQLAYTLISGVVKGIIAARHRTALSGNAAYRFSLKPLRDQISREVTAMCH